MKRTIEKIISFIVNIAEPDKIILFGSMAKGTYDVNSDLDILIMKDEKIQKRQIVERVEQFVQEFALHVDVLVYSKSEIETAISNPNSFLSSVYKEGKIVYENQRD
jgi:uncharacterized protein